MYVFMLCVCPDPYRQNGNIICRRVTLKSKKRAAPIPQSEQRRAKRDGGRKCLLWTTFTYR